jgi:hypothetical protein
LPNEKKFTGKFLWRTSSEFVILVPIHGPYQKINIYRVSYNGSAIQDSNHHRTEFNNKHSENVFKIYFSETTEPSIGNLVRESLENFVPIENSRWYSTKLMLY